MAEGVGRKDYSEPQQPPYNGLGCSAQFHLGVEHYKTIRTSSSWAPWNDPGSKVT